MICMIEDEYLEELITQATRTMGESDMIKFLLEIIDRTENSDTVQYLKRRVEELSETHMICKECGCELEPILTKEYHNELDGNFFEKVVTGHNCNECGNKYEY